MKLKEPSGVRSDKTRQASIVLQQTVERLETIEALKPAIAEMKLGKGESPESLIAELLARSSTD